MHLLCDLPYVAAKKLFHFIDYDTRLSLRTCSKRTKIWIDTLPIYIYGLKISTDPFYIKFSDVHDGVLAHSDMGNLLYGILRETFLSLFNVIDETTIENTVDKLKMILRNKNIRIKYFKVSLVCNSPGYEEVTSEQVYLVTNLMKVMLASLGHSIRVENFWIIYNGDQQEVLCFLPFFKPGTLKTIRLDNVESEKVYFDQVLILPQVVQSNTVWFRRMPENKLSLESFWNIPLVRFDNAVLDFHEINQLIQHYFQNDTFKYFLIIGVSEQWFPDNSQPFVDEKNNKAMIVEGPKFAIKIIHNLEYRAIVLDKIPLKS
ncbi:hypothetical protein GCK72_022892 [Caenorhabditis remanei]|uniref:Uncharacterized protein n=1 Tax=Caenorhabditis remanei TaxID=31234 RepID=E3MLN5_CAERE|nr:hypothetical protein GCK72_022892 [Caenorhabditis remanei]EFP04531.1 hypothetical protein CRE_31222 [Caenorhabditis remanei]KAF1746436.1 hypothetical protein GCK72_022892 [Caenorhabditis remanei]